jgi:starch-binding outer membrane protein, SusD/RagB family
MRNNFLKLLIFLFASANFLSCKKTLETSPKNSLDLNFALNTREGLQATLIAIYNSMQGSGYYGRDFVVIPELLADNCEITVSNSNRFIGQANNTPNNHVNIWSAAYSNINRANIVLSAIDANTKVTNQEKQTWKGEAYFLRALMYHDLVKTYARAPLFLNSAVGGTFDLGVPIITTPVTTASVISFPDRKKISEVYDFIMQDLMQANTLLTNTGSSNRPRRVAAQALASRVELYRGNWAQSERWADSVLLQNSTPLAPATTYFNNTVSAPSWGNAHPEQIFGLSYQTGEANPGTDALQYIYYRNLTVSPAIQGYGDVTTQLSLRNDMGVVANASIDQRFTKLVSQQVKSSQLCYYSTKWPGLRTLGQDDVMLLRTSEVLLNRAEARANQGGAKEALAIADINLTRTRAGLTAFPTAGAGTPTGAVLISEILKERRIELAYEGHRLFDLLRTGRDINKNPSSILFGSSAYQYLIAGILQSDHDTNPNLVRNPGY